MQYEDSDGSGIEEVKVGLHSCGNKSERFVAEWTMPLCRHYLLDNASTEYESTVKGKHGEVYESLSGMKAADLDYFRDDYNAFLEEQNGFEVARGDLSVKIFPLAHCGAVGTMNRNKIRDHKGMLITDPDLEKTDSLSKQKEDWRKAVIQ